MVLNRKLLRDLFGRKGSVLALGAIVTVGVGVFIAMNAVLADMTGARDRYYRGHRLADFCVDIKRAPAQTVPQAAAIPNVSGVYGRVSMAVLVDVPHRGEPIPGTVISLPEERRPVLNDVRLVSGTWFSGTNEREAIVNHAFAQANGLRPGDRLKVLLLDRQHDVLIVGTAMSPEFVYLIGADGGIAPDPERFGVIYLGERFMQDSCNLRGAYNQILGKVHDARRRSVRNTLTLFEDRYDQYGVLRGTPSWEMPSVRFLADELRGLQVTSKIMPGLFLVIAALVLNILMERIVAQQRTIIGTLQAVGYSTLSLCFHYLGFGAAIGLAGGAGGLALAAWLHRWMLDVYSQFYALPDMVATMHWGLYGGGVLIGIVFASMGALNGMRLAARLLPAEAMRPPPPEKCGRIVLERAAFLWRPMPFALKMILRSVWRNPFRSAVNVFAATIAMAIVVLALTQVDALDYLMQYEFARVSHQDLSVSLRDPVVSGAEREIGSLPSVRLTEPQLALPVVLSNGPREKWIGVTGLDRGSRLYTPLDLHGRPVPIPDSGIVLSRKLAELLDARLGTAIRVRTLTGPRRSARAPVTAIADTFLGLPAYADIRYLSRLLGEERVVNSVLAMAGNGPRRAGLFRDLKERPSVLGVLERTRGLQQLQKTFGETMGTMIRLMVLFAGIISFGSIINAAMVSLSERQCEAATLRVLGYTPRQVARIFSGESYLLNTVGMLLGIFAGIGLQHWISQAYNTELFRFPVIIHPYRLAESVLLMTLFVVLAQVGVYRLIAGMNWLEAMKVKE